MAFILRWISLRQPLKIHDPLTTPQVFISGFFQIQTVKSLVKSMDANGPETLHDLDHENRRLRTSPEHIRAGIRSSNCPFTAGCMCIIPRYTHVFAQMNSQYWIICNLHYTLCPPTVWQIVELTDLEMSRIQGVIFVHQYNHANDEIPSNMICNIST